MPAFFHSFLFERGYGKQGKTGGKPKGNQNALLYVRTPFLYLRSQISKRLFFEIFRFAVDNFSESQPVEKNAGREGRAWGTRWGKLLKRSFSPYPFQEFSNLFFKSPAVGVFYFIQNVQTSWISHHNAVSLNNMGITQNSYIGEGALFAPLPSRFWRLPPSRRTFGESVGQRVPRVKPLARFGDFGEYQSHTLVTQTFFLSLNLNPTLRTQ